MDPASLIPVGAIIVGVAGALVALLRYNRDDAGKAVEQGALIFESYRGLIDELESTVNRLREERDRLRVRLEALAVELVDYPERVRALEHTRDALEAKLAASTAQLAALGKTHNVADDIKGEVDA